MDYNKTPIVILTRVEDKDLYSEDRNGEELNDAIYDRDAQLMETLGFVFEETVVPNDSAVNSIRQIVSAGDDTFVLTSRRGRCDSPDLPLSRLAAGYG